MPFGEIVCGSPGSGKSTYCYGKHQLFSALNRPISIVNLDPANDNIPYPCAIDISSLVTLSDVMQEYKLGPNGGMLYCMEYLEANYDWLEERLKELGKDAYVLFDLPGQVELSTNHESVKRIIERLGKGGFRVCSTSHLKVFAEDVTRHTVGCDPFMRRALYNGRLQIYIRTATLSAGHAPSRAAPYKRALQDRSNIELRRPWCVHLQSTLYPFLSLTPL